MIENPVFGPLLSEGKTKRIYAHPTDTTLAYMVSKDTITAGDGARRDTLPGKAGWSTTTTANVLRLLNKEEVATHFIEQVNATTLLIRRCTMLPIEHVQRRIATGSYVRRHPEVSEGTRFEPPLIETFLKDDARHDPQIWQQDIISMSIADEADCTTMEQQGKRVFAVLERAWATLDVTLVDLKIEFGRTTSNELVVADVIDNDSWRLWPGGDKTKMLDKQIYRNLQQVTPQALHNIADRYAVIAELTGRFVSERS